MRIIALIKRVLKEMLRDKRTLALMFIGPLLILTLVYFLFQSNGTQKADIGVRNVDSGLVKVVKNKNVKLHKVTSDKSAEKIIRKHDYDALLSQKGDKVILTLQNSDPNKSMIVKQSMQKAQMKLKSKATVTLIKTQKQAMTKMSQALAAATKNAAVISGASGVPNVKGKAPKAPSQGAVKKPKAAKDYSVKTHYLYGDKDTGFFDTFLPIMISFIVFFFVFLISGIALLRERTTGTLKRLLATPVKRGEIITGYLGGYGLLALAQTFLIVFFSIYAFNIEILGSIWLILLINVILALVALTLGLFISTFAASEFQMVQFIPIIVIPQVFFSGIIPISQMAGWLQPIARIMPLYYGADAMTKVVTKGANIMQIMPSLGALLIFVVVFLIFNLLAMRKYRKV